MKYKNVLISEYKYNVLITNLPNNLKRDKVEEIARRILKNKISNSYTMSAFRYDVNPCIITNVNEYKLYKNLKNSIEIENIDFIEVYSHIKKDERFDYIFNS